ncbi:MAG TPA: MYXO-CTERM sorting domain-containing protein [Polyangiaceae bacterium]|nr:MYXO-CTERM sorting domain-containing protein [Polyangiaceae bacterium]
MTTFRAIAPSLLALFTSAAALTLSGVAQAATTCAQDSDCGHGFTCQVSGGTACPAIACAPNENCPPIDCTPTITKECAPGACATDADCATGMVCYAQTATACPSSPPSAACDPSGPCPTPAPFDAGACTTTTTRSCVPRYLLPCTQSTDCGAGFTCMPDESCGCSGSATVVGAHTTGSPSAAPDASPPPPVPAEDAGAPTCTCAPTGTSRCVVNTVTCTTNADCPAMWTCVQPPSPLVTCGGAGVGAPSSDDGGPAVDPCSGAAPAPQPSMCQPPYYDTPGSFSDTGNASAPGAPQAATGSGNESAPAAGARPAPSSKNDSSGGCTVARGPTGTGAALGLGLMALLAIARRRAPRRSA